MDENTLSSLPSLRFIFHYLVMIPHYACAIVFAVLVGVTGHVVDREWSRTPIETFLAAFNTYLVTLPLFILLVLNIMWFWQQFYGRKYTIFELVKYTLFAVVLALPILAIVFQGFVTSSQMWGFWGRIPALFAIFGVVLLVYLLVITGLTSNDMKRHVISCLNNPRFWFSFLIVSALLLLPTVALIFPILKGFFSYFPSFIQFWWHLPYLIYRAIALAMVLPALPVVFLHYGSDNI